MTQESEMVTTMNPELPTGRPALEDLFDGHLEELRAAALDPGYVSMGTRRTGTAHEFYRYPARFPPSFAEEVIAAFSEPGDVVLDPYVGGGTTLVAAQALGRRSIGADINPLATFVTRVKTTRLSPTEITELREWGVHAEQQLKLVGRVELSPEWVSAGYLRNLGGEGVWRIRNTIALAIAHSQQLHSQRSQDMARLAILRTGQWALDMRARAPGVAEFRRALQSNLNGMLDVLSQEEVPINRPPVRIRTVGLPGLGSTDILDGWIPPKLVLTSPPYAGVYVLYHRWKVLSRKESPAPYWIAAQMDGHGMAHYTMGDRVEDQLTTYFKTIQDGFSELVSVVHPEAWVVQMVGFKDVVSHLPVYLDALSDAGLVEIQFPALATKDDGRLWREVPNRRWWTQNTRGQNQTNQTSNEVVLFHRVSRG